MIPVESEKAVLGPTSVASLSISTKGILEPSQLIAQEAGLSNASRNAPAAEVTAPR